MYAIALNELRELESEPICHRNAARLLVSNCRLLDGKDEATVLTDSGRVIRDFVDSYAASLAICDLERGSFTIPATCVKFREATLAHLKIPEQPHLHVTSREIDKCLEGLAQSDSAWSTWVSYRHKALRFCEAARSDHEKDQQIHLFQRLTKIINHLTTDVEAQMEERLQVLNNAMQEASGNVANLDSRINNVRAGLDEVEETISTRLTLAVQNSQNIINRGHDEAKRLEELLISLIQDAEQRREEAVASHHSALDVVTQRATSEAATVMASLNAALTASASLHNEIESSRWRTAEIAERQTEMEEGMVHLQAYVEALSSQYEVHGEKLSEAQERAESILGTLDVAASSAASIQTTMASSFATSSWWPYILCPTASLIFGSYGLPPSALRNLALIGLGEVTGLVVSIGGTHVTPSFSAFLRSGRQIGFYDYFSMAPSTELHTNRQHSNGSASLNVGVTA